MSNAILGPCLDHVVARARHAGLEVVKFDGWRRRTSRASTKANGGRYQPVGVIDHHTAPPVPFPLERLKDKCNISIRHPDGAVCLLNSGWAHDSGWGDRLVLAAVRADSRLPRPTDTYKKTRPQPVPGGSNPAILGNPFFVDIEVQHLGNGSPLLDVMRAALIVTNAAICEFMEWDPQTRVIGHREWTKRKTDPKWDGTSNPMGEIRADTARQMGSTPVDVVRPVPDETGDEEMAFTADEEKFLKEFVKVVSIDMGSSRHFAESAILDIRKDVVTRDELRKFFTDLPTGTAEEAIKELLRRLDS